MNLLSCLFHELLFFFKSCCDFIVHPPTPQGVFGAAQQEFVLKMDAPRDLLIDILARQDVLFVHPAGDASALQRGILTLHRASSASVILSSLPVAELFLLLR